MINFQRALKEQGISAIFQILTNSSKTLTQQQKKDLKLKGCMWAMSCIKHFEQAYPKDKRPRAAIEAQISAIHGNTSPEEITKRNLQAWRASKVAATEASGSKAHCATRAAAYATEPGIAGLQGIVQYVAQIDPNYLGKIEDDLIKVFDKWEREDDQQPITPWTGPTTMAVETLLYSDNYADIFDTQVSDDLILYIQNFHQTRSLGMAKILLNTLDKMVDDYVEQQNVEC